MLVLGAALICFIGIEWALAFCSFVVVKAIRIIILLAWNVMLYCTFILLVSKLNV